MGGPLPHFPVIPALSRSPSICTWCSTVSMTTEALNPELFLPPPLCIHLAPSNLPLLFPTPLPLFGPSGSCIGLRPPPHVAVLVGLASISGRKSISCLQVSSKDGCLTIFVPFSDSISRVYPSLFPKVIWSVQPSSPGDYTPLSRTLDSCPSVGLE